MHGLIEPFGYPFAHSYLNAAVNVQNALLFCHLIGVSLRFMCFLPIIEPTFSLQMDKMQVLLQFSILGVGVYIYIDYNNVFGVKIFILYRGFPFFWCTISSQTSVTFSAMNRH